MDYSNLTNEQMEQARACKTPEDLMNLIQTEGLELTDEQLDAIAGGSSGWEDVTGCEGYGIVQCDWYCVD